MGTRRDNVNTKQACTPVNANDTCENALALLGVNAKLTTVTFPLTT